MATESSRAAVKAHCLSGADKDAFTRTKGYLLVPGALSEAAIERTLDAVDRHARPYQTAQPSNVNVADIIGLDPAFLDLIDCEKVFPKIWGLLGWNIWVNHSHFNVNPPTTPKSDVSRTFQYGWHRDGGAIRKDLMLPEDPLLMVKVGFYLTDVAEDGGATWVVDGVQSTASPPVSSGLLPDARPIVAERGTAIIFGNRVLHSLQSPNTSSRTRKAVFITYAYRWLQPVDRCSRYDLLGETSPIRRQLLGLTTTYNERNLAKGRSGRFYPRDDDVPLRKYIAACLGDDADPVVARSIDT